jgi:uncharacterized Tic20 family protein
MLATTIPPPTSEERNWAMAAHLSALVAVMGLPFGHIVGPLVVLLVQRERSAFVAAHAKASLNFQITVSLIALVLIAAMVVIWVTVIAAAAGTSPARDDTLPAWLIASWFATIFTFFAGAIAVLVLVIVATLAASKDEPYRYPFSITFVR